MTKTVEDLIFPLRGVAKELNKESDSITRTLCGFEDKLNKLDIGLGVWGKVDVMTKDGESFSIGYGKLCGRWSLTCKRGGVYNRLLDEGRNIRVAALPHIPDLVEELRSKIERVLQSIDRGGACDE